MNLSRFAVPAVLTIAAQAGAVLAADTPYRLDVLAAASNPLYPNSASLSVPTLAGDGRLYAVAGYGGANGNGVIYRIEADRSVTTLYNFSAASGTFPSATNADGVIPAGALVEGKDGALYGVAYGGGAYGGGTVFRITRTGQFSTLHSFPAFDYSTADNTEGSWPQGPLAVGSDGNLYGIASHGGTPNGGTVFRLAPDGSGFTVLHTFGDDKDRYGAFPSSGLIRSRDGNFYAYMDGGIDSYQSMGSVFRLSPAGEFSVIYRFPGYQPTAPLYPAGGLVEGADGALYGAANGLAAVLYRIGKDGSYTVLHTTGSNAISAANPDGSQYGPNALLPLPDGSFYGVTAGGGPFSGGSLFRMTADGQVTSLYFLGSSAQGPLAPTGLALGADGALYGSSASGGSTGQGSLFRLPLPPPAGWGQGAAPKVRVSLSPTRVKLKGSPQSARLEWTSDNASACLISGSDGMAEAVMPANGSMNLKPAVSAAGVVRYYVSCTGSRQGSTIVPLLVER